MSVERGAGSGSLRETAAFIAQRLESFSPKIGIVLGSGLGGLASAVQDGVSLPYGEIPGFPQANVDGHQGVFTAGRLLPIRICAALGIETVIITNAAGGIRFGFEPPLLMLIADHVNLTWQNPLVGPVAPGDERFPDMSSPYDATLRAMARKAALEAKIVLEEGVYAGVTGPHYETPAEIRMLERLGADAVGMSTVPEVIAARARGVRVLGISAITNRAAGISQSKLSHQEVLDAGRKVGADLEALIRGVLRQKPL